VLIGYARVSTDSQILDLQVDCLIKSGVDPRNIFTECMSGRNLSRPELQKMLDFIKEEDTLIVYKLDRLARSLPHLIYIVQTLEAKKVHLNSVTENIDTRSPSGKLLINLFGSLAEFERDVIMERTKAGIAAAKARGAHLGRPFSLNALQYDQIKELLRQGKTVSDISKILGIKSRTPIYHYLKNHPIEKAAS